MMAECRFEDRLAGTALVMRAHLACITASSPGELDQAFASIQKAQADGCWIALQLDYELGEWLDPALAQSPTHEHASTTLPRLTAWVFADADHASPWAAPDDRRPAALEWVPGVDTATYLETVDALRACMARGEFYQANYTIPLDVATPTDLRHLYRLIANAHPSAHAAYFQDARRTILSFSPELFVARQDQTLTVRPMKGTAPRDPDPQQDRRNADALLASTKDRAENLMIVDLLRNDLGRIASPGSVQVDSLFSLERYPSVWTMTSTITAQAPGCSLRDILVALFPCGSITGAPKIAAMRKLRQVEPQPRGIYCGSLGWLAPDGDFSLNVAIRTLEFPAAGTGATATPDTSAAEHPGPTPAMRHGRFGVGGGIVHDSIAQREWQECLWKSRLLTLPDTRNANTP